MADASLNMPEPATTAADWKTTDVGSVFVSTYPPYSFWEDGPVGAVEDMLARTGEAETPNSSSFLHSFQLIYEPL